MSTAPAATHITLPRSLHLVLWVAQVLLALAFVAAGAMKVFTPYTQLIANPQMAWAIQTGEMTVKLAGFSELLGAVGLILPSALRIKPMLSGLAATGLTVVMVLATALHLFRGELPGPSIILAVMSAFVAWGRLLKAPILPRAINA